MNQTKVYKHARCCNLRYCNVNRDENPQRVNEMDSPSFNGFHAQLDWKLTYGNENQTHLTLLQYISFVFKNKTGQSRNDEKYNQTGITVKIHTNHDGVRATAIMLRSIATSLSWSSQWSKPQKVHRLPFQWKNKSLLQYPSRCVEWKATSVTAAEFYGAVIPSNLYVPVNSAVVHS